MLSDSANNKASAKTQRQLLLSLKALIGSCLFTVLALYLSNPGVAQKKPASIQNDHTAETDTLKISFFNPNWEEQSAGKPILNEHNSTFNPELHARRLEINIAQSSCVKSQVLETIKCFSGCFFNIALQGAGKIA